jgi:hypothetical protein
MATTSTSNVQDTEPESITTPEATMACLQHLHITSDTGPDVAVASGDANPSPIFDFSMLPTELRLKVIRFTFEPQVIDVWFYDPFGRRLPRSRTRFPIALQINRESRREALRFYEPMDLIDVLEKRPRTYRNLYIDPANDTVCFKAVRPQPDYYKGAVDLPMDLSSTLRSFYPKYNHQLSLRLEDFVSWDQLHNQEVLTKLLVETECECARKLVFHSKKNYYNTLASRFFVNQLDSDKFLGSQILNFDATFVYQRRPPDYDGSDKDGSGYLKALSADLVLTRREDICLETLASAFRNQRVETLLW